MPPKKAIALGAAL
jgi:hypothetical protein